MAGKTTTIQVRVDAELKKKVEVVCKRMDISMSQAIRMFLRYVVETGKIPFDYVDPGEKRKSSES